MQPKSRVSRYLTIRRFTYVAQRTIWSREQSQTGDATQGGHSLRGRWQPPIGSGDARSRGIPVSDGELPRQCAGSDLSFLSFPSLCSATVSLRSATPDASMTLQEPAWRVKSRLRYLLAYVTPSLSFSPPLPILSARTMYVR